MYNCPACDQVADNDTIACDECNEWFHFGCIGVDRSRINDIPDEIPFICLFCNDKSIVQDISLQLDSDNTGAFTY